MKKDWEELKGQGWMLSIGPYEIHFLQSRLFVPVCKSAGNTPKYTISHCIRQELLCIQFQADHQRPVDSAHDIFVQVAYFILQALFINGAQLFQKHH